MKLVTLACVLGSATAFIAPAPKLARCKCVPGLFWDGIEGVMEAGVKARIQPPVYASRVCGGSCLDSLGVWTGFDAAVGGDVDRDRKLGVVRRDGSIRSIWSIH
jgi:hypothetical protein